MKDALRQVALAVLVVAGCATGSTPGSGTDAPPSGVDAPAVDAPAIDAPAVDAPDIDATVVDARIIDAATTDAATTDSATTDAPTDAATPTDAPPDACVPTTTQRLNNPALDNTPVGVGWTEQPFDVNFPLITSDALPSPPAHNPAYHTGPYKAFLGGFTSAADAMYQDVAIPAGTTMLVMRGQYWVGTDETVPGVYDHAYVELTNTSGTVLETVLAVSDDTVTGGWTPFSRTFTGNYAGQTVRIRFRSTNDVTDVTAFWFDSFALDRTGCP